MKKIIFFLSIITALLFQGCINLEIETFLGADGSGSSIIHYWTKLDFLYQDTSYSNKYSFKEDIIRKNFENESIKIKSIKVWEKSADTTYHAAIKIIFEDINELNKCNFFRDCEISFKDGAAGQKIFVNKIKGGDLHFSDGEKYTLKYIYHFPGAIITDNADERKNNTLIWNFTLDQLKDEKTLTATIKTPVNYGLKYVIPVLIFILLGLWIIIIVRKRKKSQEEYSV
ncbi:MAG: hypothetical protein NUV92_00240 [Ignavibacteria bacterium]|jgi:hypothetical protein|nr:hypothetical protein [Ignavibacteria bacterium]MDH7528841.1 hypothetical protein [Ignavibacteria bacterium]